MTHCRLQHNEAREGGGLKASGKSRVVMQGRTSLVNNAATRCGGGLQGDSTSDLFLHDVSFWNNTAGLSGAGVCLKENSRLTASGTNFTLNRATQGGGGLYTTHTHCDRLVPRLGRGVGGDDGKSSNSDQDDKDDKDNAVLCIHLNQLRFDRNTAVMGHGLLWEDWHTPRRPLACQNCSYYHAPPEGNEGSEGNKGSEGRDEATTVVVTTTTTTTTTGASGQVRVDQQETVEGDKEALQAMYDGDQRHNDVASNSAQAQLGMHVNDTVFGWLNDTQRLNRQSLVAREVQKQLHQDAANQNEGGDTLDGTSAGRHNNSVVSTLPSDEEWLSKAAHNGEVLESGVPFCNAGWGLGLGDPETCQAVLNCQKGTLGCDDTGMLTPGNYATDAVEGDVNYYDPCSSLNAQESAYPLKCYQLKKKLSTANQNRLSGTKGWRHTPHIVITDFYHQINALDTSSMCEIHSDGGLTVQPSSSKANQGVVPFCTTNQDGYPMCTQDSTMSAQISFSSMAIKGGIGSRSTLKTECYTWDGKPLHTNARSVEIGPCAKGKELSPLGVCVACAAGYYSPHGRKCLACPEGGLCEMTATIGNNVVSIGVEEPLARPGYWVGPPPSALVQRVAQDKGYCDWDPLECEGEEGCGSGLCAKRCDGTDGTDGADGTCTCSTTYTSEMGQDRLYHCLFHRFLYSCPFDDIGCIGTLQHCINGYVATHAPLGNVTTGGTEAAEAAAGGGATASTAQQHCASQHMVMNRLIPEQQAHVSSILTNSRRYVYDNEHGTGSIGLQQDGYTCAQGYTGLKCGVCRFASNQSTGNNGGGSAGVSYYRSRGICTPCLQVAANDATLSKLLYAVMFVGGKDFVIVLGIVATCSEFQVICV